LINGYSAVGFKNLGHGVLLTKNWC
jgi:hypothetical protein